MLVCVSKKTRKPVLVTRRSRTETVYVATIAKKRKLITEENRYFEKEYFIIGKDFVSAANLWLNSPLHMATDARKELEMVLGLKKNAIAFKGEDVAEVPEGLEIVTEAGDLKGRSMKSLKALYKKLGGEDETVTESEDTLTAAIWALAEAFTPEVKEPKTPREKKAPEDRQARYITGKLSGESIITVIAETNPKREGSKAHAAFSCYRTGQTVKEFVEAGGTLGDVRWDSAHGYISLEHVEPAPKEAKEEDAAE